MEAFLVLCVATLAIGGILLWIARARRYAAYVGLAAGVTAGLGGDVTACESAVDMAVPAASPAPSPVAASAPTVPAGPALPVAAPAVARSPHTAARPPQTPTELLLPFLRGEGADASGRRLEDIRAYDFEQLERVHDWVQWVFPTDEQSMFNMHAPLLTPELQQAVKGDATLRREMRSSLRRFCEFLGFEMHADDAPEAPVAIVIGSGFPERVPDCWSSMFGGNHNWLRVSRVLQCLGLCGLHQEQQALLACLEMVFAQRLAPCASAIPHWRQRAKTVPALR